MRKRPAFGHFVPEISGEIVEVRCDSDNRREGVSPESKMVIVGTTDAKSDATTIKP